MRPSLAIFYATIAGIVASHVPQIGVLIFAIAMFGGVAMSDGNSVAPLSDAVLALGGFAFYLALAAAPFVLTFWTLYDYRARLRWQSANLYYFIGGALGLPVVALVVALACAPFGIGPVGHTLIPPLVSLGMHVFGMFIPGAIAGAVMGLVRDREASPAA